MNIGLFSVSLTVKDIAASKEFYEKLGFTVIGGEQEQEQGWIILNNGDCKIGLFQGMFDKNMLTFNPGWGPDGAEMDEFEDVRDIQKRFKVAGIKLLTEADETTKGPASITLEDPDGNPILVDQHV